MKFTVTWYNISGDDPHIEASVIDMLREGIAPSRIGIRAVKSRASSYFFQYGLSITALSDIYGEGELPEDDDPFWDQVRAVYERLGL